MTIVVCHRDPDSSNEYKVFGEPEPRIIDIDYGRSDLRDPEEFADWRDAHLETVKQLYALGTSEAYAAGVHICEAVAEAADRYGHVTSPEAGT